MAIDDAQFKLRLSGSLHARLTNTAHDNKRSINAEIVTRLEQSFVERSADISVAESVAELDRKLGAICEHLGIKTDN